MARFTMTLRQLTQTCDIGLDEYPIFNEEYRGRLNKVIVNHFMFREISAESPAQFIFKLNAKMDEIMPYYNTLFTAMSKLDGTLSNRNIQTETDERNREVKRQNTQGESVSKGRTQGQSEDSTSSTTNGSTSDNTTSQERFSDTPQGMIAQAGGSTIAGFTDQTYLTEATARIDSSSGTSNSSTTASTDSTSESVRSNESSSAETKDTTGERDRTYKYSSVGYEKKSLAQLFGEYADNLLNLEMKIIRDLEPLFIQVL